ncbi:MAG: histidinol-phosphate transaminase [Nitrospira sp.]|nr:histidinol-phosphate transaminase [Nitrospira sp.]
MPIRIHPDIAKLVPYSPGKPLDELDRELGIGGAVKLASNENPLGPSPNAIAALDEGKETLHLYPDGGAHHLTRALADRWKVSGDQVVVGNGSDEIISLLVKTFMSPGEEAVMADHTFVMYRLAVTGGHGVCVEVPLNDWRYDLPAMARAVTDLTRVVFVCNPNNPTGTMVTRDEVREFMAAVPDHVIVVFDEAYYEYVRDPQYPDALEYVRQNRAVVVLRTFSKIYGLAGLRIGYGLTTPEIAGYLHRVRNPFNANTLAQFAARAALGDERHVAASRALNETEMASVDNGLRALGLAPLPSQANFLYFDTRRDGRAVFDRLLQEGVIVRHIVGSMLRVTIGRPEENRRFLTALGRVLESLPMDKDSR